MPLLQFLQGLLFEKGIFENLFRENFIHRKVGFSFPVFLKPFCKIPASKGFQICLKDFFYKKPFFKKGVCQNLFQNTVSSLIKPLFSILGRRSDPNQEQCLLSIRGT
jgi:hypothetical protein